ncbi:MAG: GAF domain-containing protein [Firmicutes bacterium]|nr:GAF domain-containing protein [Bacillota bacterium]
MHETNEIINKWKEVIDAIKEDPTFRPITLESWNRCKNLGVNADQLIYTFLSKDELIQKQHENYEIIKAATPYLQHLSLSLKGKPHMVVLADKDGWIIAVHGTPEDLGGKAAGLYIGANWSEKYIGNNGVGTALALGEAVLVYGVEHYGMPYKGCTCLGIPIKKNNEIVGVIDISVSNEHAHPSRLNLVQACVNSIETQLSSASGEDYDIDKIEKLLATGSLLSTTVHDIKNPLTIIKGLAQLGTMTSKNDKESEYFQRIVGHVEELTSMLNNFLSFFRNEEEGFSKCSPTEVMKEIIEEVQPICKVQEITLEYSIKGNIYTKLNTSLFKRAIHNLIKNASQVLTTGGKISLRIDCNEKHLHIDIEDTGPGLPSNIEDDIFKPFVQGRTNGTGLGLFMVHYVITKVHKGHIWFKTKQNIGTTFYIEIPVKEMLEDESVLSQNEH